MSEQPPTRPHLDPGAAVSLILGVLSVPLSLIAAIPAFILGLRALRAINESEGALRGRGLAVAGMVLSVLAGTASAAGLGIVIVMRLRATASRVECANNLRALGLAVRVYHDYNHDHFPPGTVLALDLLPQKRLSWLVLVLPNLPKDAPTGRAAKGIFAELDLHQPWDADVNTADRRRVAVFLCPAAPIATDPTPPGRTSYVGLAGVDPDAAMLPKTNPRAGFFGYERILSDDDLVAGTTYTMMAAETGQENGPWAAGGPATVRGLQPDLEHYVGPGRPFGRLHAGGANILWADGAVRFASETIPAPLFRAQATLSGTTKASEERQPPD
jgi:prepilin-type processing-associated H-X9-DG protein